MIAAKSDLTRELTLSPSIDDLRIRFQQLERESQNANREFSVIRDEYGLSAVRFEVCMDMQFEARKSQVFIRAYEELIRNGCADTTGLMYRARGYAEKEGLAQAIKIACERPVADGERGSERVNR